MTTAASPSNSVRRYVNFVILSIFGSECTAVSKDSQNSWNFSLSPLNGFSCNLGSLAAFVPSLTEESFPWPRSLSSGNSLMYLLSSSTGNLSRTSVMQKIVSSSDS